MLGVLGAGGSQAPCSEGSYVAANGSLRTGKALCLGAQRTAIAQQRPRRLKLALSQEWVYLPAHHQLLLGRQRAARRRWLCWARSAARAASLHERLE